MILCSGSSPEHPQEYSINNFKRAHLLGVWKGAGYNMKNFKGYNYQNFEFIVNGRVIIITAWSTSTRSGFTHQCNSIDFPEVTKSRICYLNRTWECFRYESVLKAFARKLPKSVQASILEQIDNYSEMERIKACKSVEVFSRTFEALSDAGKERIKRIFADGVQDADNAQMVVNMFGALERLGI